jgi:hypothetical protein
MIDETRLRDLRQRLSGPAGPDAVATQCATWADLADTVETLWKVARAARRWQKAPPGRESSERESELVELLKALPPEG